MHTVQTSFPYTETQIQIYIDADISSAMRSAGVNASHYEDNGARRKYVFGVRTCWPEVIVFQS
jgi:hypothetical protein